MTYEPTNLDELHAVMKMCQYAINQAQKRHYAIATVAGMYRRPVLEFSLLPGGFGLISHLIQDQTDIYSPHRAQPWTGRHSCNIWFANESFNAEPSSWVIEVFNRECEPKLHQLQSTLLEAGFPDITLLRKNEPPRPVKTLADYGLVRS